MALELAAARLNILSLDELSARLNERFSLLRSRGRDAKALDGALDWSWGLLQPWAKAALSQASLFRGGFTLAAAEGVIDVGRHPKTPAMFDILGELVDNSLLRKDQIDSGRVRYSLLESIRAYADFKLGHPGEMGPELRGEEAMERAQQRHAVHYSHLGTPQALRALDGFDSAARWDELFAELDNLVAAIGYGTSKTAPLCCLAALKVLGMKGPVSLGVDISSQVLAMDGLGRRVRMLLEIERSKCLRISGRMAEARAMVGTTSVSPQAEKADSSLPTHAKSIEDTDTIIDSLLSRKKDMPSNVSEAETDRMDDADLVEAERLLVSGVRTRQSGNAEQALDDLQAAGEYFHNYGEEDGEGRVMSELGWLHHEQDRPELAIKCLRESVRLHEKSGNRRLLGMAQGRLAQLLSATEQSEQAIDFFESAIVLATEVGDQRSETQWHMELGSTLRDLERWNEAESSLRRAIIVGDELAGRESVEPRYILAKVLSQQGRNQEALTLLQTVQVSAQVENDYRSLMEELLSRLGKPQSNQAPKPPVVAAERLLEVGKAELDHSHFASAMNDVEQSPKRTRSGGNRRNEGTRLENLGEEDEPTSERDLALIDAERMLELGNIEYNESNFPEAMRCLEKALEQFQALGEFIHQGHAMVVLGQVYMEVDDLEHATRLFEQARQIYRGERNLRGEAEVLGLIGVSHHRQHAYQSAIDHLSRAIQIQNKMGDVRRSAIHLRVLGLAYKKLGQPQTAIEVFQQALEIHRNVGDRKAEGSSLGMLALAHSWLGELEHALELNQEAIAIHREVGAKRSESICLGNWRTATKRWVNIQTPYSIMNERFESMENWAPKDHKESCWEIWAMRSYSWDVWMKPRVCCYRPLSNVERLFQMLPVPFMGLWHLFMLNETSSMRPLKPCASANRWLSWLSRNTVIFM